MASGSFGIKEYLTSSGVIAEDVDIFGDTTVVLMTFNAAPSNEIALYGRLAGQETWTLVDTLVGSGRKEFSVKTFEYLRVECTSFSALGSRVLLVGNGFELVQGLAAVTIPSTTFYDVNILEFLSPDSSILITDEGSGKIGLKTNSSALTKYTKNILLGDWSGPSAGEYVIVIPFTTHAVQNPVVTCYEGVSGVYSQLLTSVSIDSSHNVTVSVPSAPDLRFAGKIIIE